MKKSTICLFVLSLLFASTFGTGGKAFGETISGTGITWTLTSGTLTLDYSSGVSAMPSTWSTSGAPWYSSRASITSIVIKDGITSIGKNAFYNCSAATTVQISSTVTSIGADAFYGCSALTRVNYRKNNMNSSNKTTVAAWAQITFANDKANPLYYAHRLYYVGQKGQYSYDLIENTGPTLGATIKDYALVNCTTMTTVTIPATTTAIGKYAFSGCTGLRTVTFSGTSQVASIGEYAFNGCNNAQFTSITIPESVTSVGSKAFLGCTNLTTVNWNARNCADFSFTSGQYASYTTPFYYNSSNHMAEKIQTLNFGSNVEHIPAYLCQGMTNANLTTVTIPASVTSVGASGFGGSTKLTSVNYLGTIEQWCGITFANSASNPLYYGKNLKLNGSNFSTLDIPSGVENIGAYQFYNAQNVTTLNIPTNVTYVGIQAFTGCSNITAVNYAGSAADWSRINFSATNEGTCPLYYGEDMLFCNGSKPTSVVVPNGVTKISPFAFYKCTSLTSVTLNDDGSLTQVMNNAFRGCTGVTEIIVPNSVTTIGADAFNACTGLTSLTLGSSLAIINSSAFNGCTSLAGTLTIPSAVTQISSYAFKNCSSLTGLDLTNASALKTISSSSFTGCTNIIGDLYIPAAVTKIENNAFEDLSGITAIFATPTTAPTAYAATFTNMVKTIPFYVLTPDALTSYSGSDKWNVFTNMKIGGYCGAASNKAGVKWELNTTSGVLTIFGSGAMANYASENAPWYALRASITSVVVEDGVTAIGNYAFEGCSSLVNVAISNDVASLGQRAFYNCTKLATLTLPTSLTAIAARLFEGCTKLSTISIPTNVTTINSYAFLGCSKLSSVSMSNVASIGQEAFNGCASLTNITLPETLTTIGLSAFKNCGLTSITIPRNVTTITCYSGTTTYATFEGCSSLTTIVWNARTITSGFGKITYSGTHYAVPFESIKTQITSITFGPNVEAIPNYLCHGFSNITSVTIPVSVTSVGSETFEGCTNLASVTSQATTPPTIQSTTFSGASSKKLYVPHSVSVKAAYRGANYWSSFTEANTFPKIVQFDLNGKTGDAIDPQYFDNLTSKASAPDEPSVTGYTFGGWYQEGCENAFKFSSTDITADQTLYAKWTINTYDVTFNLQGHGDPIAPQSIEYNGLVGEPLAPSEENYIFGGWYKEAGCSNAWDFSTDRITAATTLYAKWTMGDLALNENADNSGALDAYNGHTTDVTMTRSLTSAQYNTFCLPFSLSSSQMTTAFGAGYDLEELTNVAFDAGTKELTLTFTKKSALEAGKPYLLQPANDVSNPSFTGVTISNATPSDGLDNGYIEFHGVYSPTSLTGGNKNLLFLGAGNTLFFPETTGDLKGFRAYFEVKGAAAGVAVRARIVRHEDTVTSVDIVESQKSKVESVKVIHDGQLLILRDSKTYNAQGMLVK